MSEKSADQEEASAAAPELAISSSSSNGTAVDRLSFSDFLLAATLINDAKQGIDGNFEKEETHIRSYLFYTHWTMRWTLYLFLVVNLGLGLFEDPAVSGMSLPYWGTIIIELASLVFFLFRIFHAWSFSRRKEFWRDRKNIVVLVVVLLTFIDMIVFIVLKQVGTVGALRATRVLRPLFMVNFAEGRQVRRAFRNIRRTVPDTLNVLALFIMMIMLFALMAAKLFSSRNFKFANGDPYFANYWDGWWSLYVLVTTANNPDVMMPAYDDNRWMALFFVVYVIICLYIFMSIFLAVIYNHYKRNLKNEVKKSVYMKIRKLRQAFDIVKVSRNGRFVVLQQTWMDLMAVVSPNHSHTHHNILWQVLDADGDNYIVRREFLHVADLLSVRMTEVKDRMLLLQKLLPNCYNSKPNEILIFCVKHRFFRYFFDLMILANAGFIGASESLDSMDEAEFFFISIFTLELALKMYAHGLVEFFSQWWNIFDFVIIGSAVLATTIEALMGEQIENRTTLDVLLVLRVLRLIKIVGSVQRFKVIIMTILNIGPSIIIYGGVLFVFYYMFAIIGMEIFSGKIRYFGYNETLMTQYKFCGNSKLSGSTFVRVHYCNNNFNNILNSFVVLFELTVVNQWHVLSSGFVMVTSKVARLFFLTFHLVCVILVLNIFTAFVLEAFILEYNFSRSKHESAIERKIIELGLNSKKKEGNKEDRKDLVDGIEVEDVEIGGDPQPLDKESSMQGQISEEVGIKFHISQRPKDVQTLLQRMFEDEIGSEDEGPEDLDNDEQLLELSKNRTYTIDNF